MAKPPELKDPNWSKIHPWFKAAHDYAKLNASWFSFKRETEQYEAWEKYFARLGWAPVAFSTLTGDKEFTAPCEWPEWMTIEIPSSHSRPRQLEVVT